MNKYFIFIVFLFLISCANHNNFDPHNIFGYKDFTYEDDLFDFDFINENSITFSKIKLDGILNISVLDSITNEPIGGAYVYVQTKTLDTYTKFSGYTDINGNILFNDQTLTNSIDLTIGKKNYTTFSIFKINSSHLTIYLEKIQKQNLSYEISGKFNGWPSLADDGVFDVGIMIPSQDLGSLLSFSMNTILAPSVVVDIYGERELPGNIVIPTQTETYMIFPIRISKPTYIFPLNEDLYTDLVALTIRLPFKELVSKMKAGENFSDIFKLAKFHKLGVKRDYTVKKKDVANIDLEYSLDETVEVNFGNQPKNKSIALISGFNFNTGSEKMLLTGLKIKNPKDTKKDNLPTTQEQKEITNLEYIFGAISFTNPELQIQGNNILRDYRINGSIKRFARTFPNSVDIYDFLASITNLKIENNNFSFEREDTESTNVSADIINSNIYDKDKNKIWKIITNGDVNSFALPNIPNEVEIEKIPSNFEWRVNALAFTSGYNINKNLTHFSTNRISH
jgi:hypothetical protein